MSGDLRPTRKMLEVQNFKKLQIILISYEKDLLEHRHKFQSDSNHGITPAYIVVTNR